MCVQLQRGRWKNWGIQKKSRNTHTHKHISLTHVLRIHTPTAGALATFKLEAEGRNRNWKSNPLRWQPGGVFCTELAGRCRSTLLTCHYLKLIKLYCVYNDHSSLGLPSREDNRHVVAATQHGHWFLTSLVCCSVFGVKYSVVLAQWTNHWVLVWPELQRFRPSCPCYGRVRAVVTATLQSAIQHCWQCSPS